MRAIRTLAERIARETEPYRKGEVVTEHPPKNGVQVTEIFDMPPTPERGKLVDVFFFNVGFTEAAADKDGFLADLKAACAEPGEFVDISEERLTEGPSCIELGQWLGSQDFALRFIALGAHYQLWQVITPLTILGPDGDPEAAREMAGMGFVFASGYEP